MFAEGRDSSVPVPKCPQPRDSSAPISWCRNVFSPKCPGSEVSWHHKPYSPLPWCSLYPVDM